MVKGFQFEYTEYISDCFRISRYKSVFSILQNQVMFYLGYEFYGTKNIMSSVFLAIEDFFRFS